MRSGTLELYVAFERFRPEDSWALIRVFPITRASTGADKVPDLLTNAWKLEPPDRTPGEKCRATRVNATLDMGRGSSRPRTKQYQLLLPEAKPLRHLMDSATH